MTDKITIKPEQVVSRKAGKISYYDEGNTLRQAKAKDVIVLGEGEQPKAEDTPPSSADAADAADARDAAGLPPAEAQTPADTPAETTPGGPPPESPKPSKRGKKAKEDTDMATKTAAKKSAPKKKAAASKAPREGARGVRTIGGKPVDVSGYVKVKTPGGGTSLNNGDPVAEKLQGKTLDDVYSFVAKTLKVEVKELKAKYGKLNVGMQRMNLGNRLRKVMMPKAAKA